MTTLVNDGLELRRTLFLEFRAAADDVRQAAGDGDSLVRAVHGYRKALRRARAIFKLFATELAGRERREIWRALTEARRALGDARDHAVANDVLGQIESEAERDAAKGVLDRAAALAMTSAQIKQLLAEGAAHTAAQVELVEAALPERLEWRSVLSGLRATYSDARRARRDAKDSRRAFHRWRRRSKELAIQLEVLAPLGGPAFEELQHQIVAATDGTGTAVDLLMARDFARKHAGDDANVKLLTRALGEDLDGKIDEVRKAARDVFRKKPQDLARRLNKAAKHDVSPVAPPPISRSDEFAMT